MNIIEHTWKIQIWESAQGSRLNLEIDMLARYVSRLMRLQKKVDKHAKGPTYFIFD